MDHTARIALEDAIRAITSMIGRSKSAQEKFPRGSSQHTLQVNRIRALRTAMAMIENELTEGDIPNRFTRDELEQALAPIASLTSKSEKALAKLTEGTWQHKMLKDNLNALSAASPLLTKTLSGSSNESCS